LCFADIIDVVRGEFKLKIKKFVYVGLIVVLVGFLWFYRDSFAGTTEPGSQEDPLVTKSYVDSKISQVQGAPQNLDIVYLKKFQSLILNAGTEVIVRTGKSSIIAGPDGLSDVTSGQDLKTGVTVPLNHLLITPRSDGRGIKAISDTVIVMVRGKYTIK